MPYVSFALICLLFGSNFFLMDRAGTAFGPISIGAWRMGGAAAVMFLGWALTRPRPAMPWKTVPGIMAVGVISNAYPYVTMPWIIEQGVPHSFLALFVAYTPLLTIFVSAPMLGIWPSVRQVVGVLGGLGLLALVMLDGQQRDINPWLLALAVTVPFSYAVGNAYVRRSLRDVPGFPLAGIMALTGFTILAPLAWLVPSYGPASLQGPETVTNFPTALSAVLWLGVLGTGLTNWLFVRLVQSHGPLFAGMVTYVVPLVALVWGAIDRQAITTMQLIAIGGVLAMVALVQYGGGQKEEAAAEDTEPAGDDAPAVESSTDTRPLPSKI